MSWLFEFIIFSLVTLSIEAVGECSKPKVLKRTIIRSELSIQNGAKMLKKLEVDSAKNCYSACCEISSCNVAVMHYKQEYTMDGDELMKKFCFLFDCGTPSLCSYQNHNRYAIIEVPKQAPTTVITSTENKKILEEQCSPEVPRAMCASNPCEGKICSTDRNAICRPSYCGGCFAKFYDSNGNKVECNKKSEVPPTSTAESVQEALVNYVETPVDSLPPPKKLVKPTEDPYYRSERRHWVDEGEPDITNKSTSSPTTNAPVTQIRDGKVVIIEEVEPDSSFISLPLLIALIISSVLIIGLIYRFKCTRRGKPKRIPVDDEDYLINGMYL